MEKRVLLAVTMSIVVILLYPVILAKINPNLVKQPNQIQPLTKQDVIEKKIDFNKVRSQADLNTAINQAYDACAKEHPVDCGCGKGEKRKREPSAYNNFIKDCFKTKTNPSLTDCAADWKTDKRNPRNVR